MNFSTNDNYKLLREIVSENITTDMEVFNKVFKDFGKNTNMETVDLMVYNKQFLTLLQTIIHNKNDYSTAEALSQKRKVSFDNKLEEHKQHFLSYTPKPPHIPDFVDKTDNTNLGNIDQLIKQTLLTRNYEPPPTKQQQQQPQVRKINIQQQPLEHDTLTQDAINLDSPEVDPIANLFLKLQNKKTESQQSQQQPQPEQPNSVVDVSNTIPIHLQNIQNNINNIIESFEKLKLLINPT